MKNNNLTAIIGWFANSAAIVAAIALPALYFVISLQYQRGTLEAEAEINTLMVAERIARSPEKLRLEAKEMREYVEDDFVFETEDLHELRSILAPSGRLIVQGSEEKDLRWPTISATGPLTVSGKIVGYFKVERSILHLINHTAWLALASFALGLTIIMAFRTMPLRALQRAEERLRYLAHYDTLTGLANRVRLEAELHKVIARAKRNHCMVAVLFLDIDKFKLVNDSLGQRSGDRVLEEAAARIKTTVRTTDLVARLGGDEFAVVIEGIRDQKHVCDAAFSLAERFRVPFEVDGRPIHLSVSIGISLYPTDACEPERLLRFADMAMYEVKKREGDYFLFYEPVMHQHISERMRLRLELQRALDRSEFVLFYQPLFDSQRGNVVGVEALIRWQHPTRGLVYPNDFIGGLEESGLIVPVGAWVIREACRQAKRWQAAGFADLYYSVNVSPRQFREVHFVDTVRRILEEEAMPAKYLQLEVTESMLMEDDDDALRMLKQLDMLGISLSLDDFGTGYSSLSRLKRYPLHSLKIDKSFVRDMTFDPEDASIVQTIIQLGHSLNLQVVAEGVETEPQLESLRQQDCDIVQGYLFAQPLEAPAAAEVIAAATPVLSGTPSGESGAAPGRRAYAVCPSERA